MKVENVDTGKMVRIPRKLKKRIEKDGSKCIRAGKSKRYPWYVFMIPQNEWYYIARGPRQK